MLDRGLLLVLLVNLQHTLVNSSLCVAADACLSSALNMVKLAVLQIWFSLRHAPLLIQKNMLKMTIFVCSQYFNNLHFP